MLKKYFQHYIFCSNPTHFSVNNAQPVHLHDKVNILLTILEQYAIISPVNKEQQPKGNTFINPVIILIKENHFKSF